MKNRSWRRARLLCIACFVAGLALMVVRHAASAAPAPAESDPIDRELFGPESKPTPPSGPKAEPKRAVEPAAIVDQMVQSARRLGDHDSGPATQQLQRRIIAQLEEVLRQAGKEPNDSGSSTQNSSPKVQPGAQPKTDKADPNGAQTKPGAQPNPGQAAGGSKGPGGDARGAASRMSLLRRVWGDLPERQRDEILRLQPLEEFLPEYEVEIEAYFRRLAEGRESGEGRGKKGDGSTR
jgi:hypothetical protein